MIDFRVPPVPLFLKHQQRIVFVGGDVIETDAEAELQSAMEIQSPPKQMPGLTVGGGVELVERAVVTPAVVVGRIGTQLRVAQFVPAQGPVDEESQGWPVGPRAA